MIDLELANRLLDFGNRIGRGSRSDAQLAGAVAIHNILEKHRVAYLADEVGMGKTYVALGAIALFRHFRPDFRVLFLAPRENIQRKWQKELRNFARYNVQTPDMRMTSLDGGPPRPLVFCTDLLDLASEASLDPDRDFFTRMSSFSLGLPSELQHWTELRERVRALLPWLDAEAFDLRTKDAFKDHLARAVCCALPRFDLVVVDEAHNFKHGLASGVAARNRVVAEVFGCSTAGQNDRRFSGYGMRAERVLMLSATPIEDDYRQLWNQLDVFGVAGPFEALRSPDPNEDEKKAVAAKFLVRRVTELRAGHQRMTKNMYRREWRAGGMRTHDQPIEMRDPRQRLIVALVQKKVSELLADRRFNHHFQVGMLASFESFLETAKLKREDETVFDDAEQADDADERDGIDVQALNRLARDYRNKFGTELPHPKMDALVEALATAWETGRKALVFVRRVASVRELKRRLDDRYDAWLMELLRRELPSALRPDFEAQLARYRNERDQLLNGKRELAGVLDSRTDRKPDDRGGHDTFFAWFFRGDGPPRVWSGARLSARLSQSTFFADNYVMDLLGVRAGEVATALAVAVSCDGEQLAAELAQRAGRYLSGKHATHADRVEAAQASALELLRERAQGALRKRAEIIFAARFEGAISRSHRRRSPAGVVDLLEERTFFSELRQPERAALRARLWPAHPDESTADERFGTAFKERELRAQFLSTAARLGHTGIDLYLSAAAGLGSLKVRAGSLSRSSETEERDDAVITRFLDRLEHQRLGGAGRWCGFDELAAIADNFALILDCNAPDAQQQRVGEAARYVARLLRKQQPAGGMAGSLNQTLVGQFRMPGYPMVLITTDLLQEGEDLHTFCSDVHHYGIAWTPSSMEQRIGRVDRVRSQTDRRLAGLERKPEGGELLQVYFPHLADTIEVLQVERVLTRMATFLRLMHEGLTTNQREERRIDVDRAILQPRGAEALSGELLETAFPLPLWALRGTRTAADTSDVAALRRRFEALLITVPAAEVTWESVHPQNALLGTAHVNTRVQPFTLLLGSDHGRAVVRCVSPIGRTEPESRCDEVAVLAISARCRVAAVPRSRERSYDLTIEEDVLLGREADDDFRVRLLIRRVVEEADRFEREHFADGRDVTLDVFADDLRKEGATHG